MLSETSADAAQHQWIFRYGFKTVTGQKNVQRTDRQSLQVSIVSTAGYRLLSGN